MLLVIQSPQVLSQDLGLGCEVGQAKMKILRKKKQEEKNIIIHASPFNQKFSCPITKWLKVKYLDASSHNHCSVSSNFLNAMHQNYTTQMKVCMNELSKLQTMTYFKNLMNLFEKCVKSYKLISILVWLIFLFRIVPTQKLSQFFCYKGFCIGSVGNDLVQ